MISYRLQNEEDGIRQAVVETDLGTFETPATTLTDNEFNNAIDASSSGDPNPPARHYVFDIRQDWDDSVVRNFKQKGFDWTEEKKEVRWFQEHHGDKLQFYRPDVSALREEGGISEEANEMIVGFALHCNFDWIPAFDPQEDSSPAVFKDRIIETRNMVRERDPNADVVPVLRIKDDPGELMSKLRIASRNGFNCVCIEMRALKQCSEQLDTIYEFTQTEDGDILLYGAHVERTKAGENQQDRVSARHLLPHYGIDLVGYCNHNHGRQPSKQDIKETPWLWPGRAKYDAANKLKSKTTDDLVCREACCEGRHVSEVFQDEMPHDNLYAHIWTHDIVTMQSEFERLRTAIKNGTVEEYYEQRERVKILRADIASR